jgi:hypothetical protein
VLWPEHTVAVPAVAVIVGVAFTVTVAVLALLHPVVVPVTVYTVVLEGLTLIVEVVGPLLQV